MNVYSCRALEIILAAFPEFREFVGDEPDDEGAFLIELDAPSGSRLWITSRGDEVTVGFDAHHVHFGIPLQPDAEPKQDAGEAVAFIRSLTEGEKVVAVWTRRGEFVGASTTAPGGEPLALGCLGGWLLKGCTVELRGWRSSPDLEASSL